MSDGTNEMSYRIHHNCASKIDWVFRLIIHLNGDICTHYFKITTSIKQLQLITINAPQHQF